MTMRPQELNPFKLASLFRKQFEMSNVQPGETIVLLTDLSTRQEFIAAAFAAAEPLDANIYEMKVVRPYSTTHIGSKTQLGGEFIYKTKGTMDAIKAADLCIVFHIPLGSQMLEEGRAAGTRFLMVYDHPDDLERLMSPPGLKDACLYTRDKIHNSKSMRVTSDAGTDFFAELGNMVTSCQYGFAEEPGRVDHWGGGHVSTWPNIGTARGTVVAKPGDCWILPYVRYIEDDLRMTIEDGIITNIEGKTDAKLMRQFFEAHRTRPGDNRPWHVSHLGWGLNPNAIWDQIAVHGPNIERIGGTGRCWPGSFLFSTGPNDQAGGTNDTPAHIDMPLFDCSVWLDDELVIDRGKIVDQKMIVPQYWPNLVAA